MLIFGCVEDAFGISEQVLASLIADGSIEVDMLGDVEFFGQLLQLFLMLDVLRHLQVISASDYELHPVLTRF